MSPERGDTLPCESLCGLSLELGLQTHRQRGAPGPVTDLCQGYMGHIDPLTLRMPLTSLGTQTCLLSPESLNTFQHKIKITQFSCSPLNGTFFVKIAFLWTLMEGPPAEWGSHLC